MKNELELSVVNEPYVFEPLKVYCILCINVADIMAIEKLLLKR